MGAIERIFRGRRGGQDRPLAAQVASLFAAGEQGLWYDVDGFREAWNNVGPELVTNSGFDGSLTGWTATGGSTQSVSGGLLTLSGGAASGGVYQDVTTTATWVVVTAQIRRVSGTGNGAVWGVPRKGSFAAPNTQFAITATVSAAPTTMAFLLQREPTAAGVRVYVQAVGGDGVFEVDSVSVREWLGSGATALYQDAAGSQPVYMPGQGQIDPPVGLLFDRRAGLTKGAELVANGGFDVDLSGWAQSIAGYWQWSAGRAYHPLGSNYADLTMAVTTTPGWAVIEFDYTVITGSGSAQWFYINAAGVGVTNASGGLPLIPTGSGRFRYVIRDGLRKIGFSRNTAAEFYIDNVTVRALPGNHAYQTTTASRPVLSARYNLLTGTDSLSTQSISVSAATYVLSTSGTGTVTLSGAASGTYAAGKRTITCAAGTLTLTVTGAVLADLRAANDGVGVPDYQRVVDANTYDTAGFPLYLRFDGVDDSLQTTSVDFSGSDKAFIAASVRKISDAATGVIAELSADLNTSNGSFFLLYPRSGTANEPVFASKGTSSSLAATASVAYPAPISSIISGIGDISGDLAARRINGVPSFISVADQGTGAYGAYPIYIGRRAGTTLPFNGRLFGLLIRGGAINDVQIGKVERYLNQKAKVY